MVDSTPLAWVLIVLASAAIVSNAVILLSVWLSVNLHTKCHYIFANWSAAHFFLNVAVLFRASVYLLQKRDKDELCRVVIGSETGGVSAVLLWAVILASDRYMAIFWPTYYKRTSSRQFMLVSVSIWTLSVAVGLILGWNVTNSARNCLLRTSLSSNLYLSFVSSNVALCVGTVAFYAIILVLTTRRLRINASISSQNMRRRNDRDLRLLVTISVVLALFLLCQMARPTVSLLLYMTSTADSHISQVSAQLATVLAVLETFGNFITFAVRSEDYRQAFVSVASCRCRALASTRLRANNQSSQRESTHGHRRRRR
uniref:G-protein coupled receptors family 1 profile domain-containing protein n=1 Tax=Plectus sambesii TaxID=2011161 RepID=A0A914UI15_9BILA